MRVLTAIIEIATLAMLHPGHHLAFSGGVALELICNDHPRNVLQAFEQLFEELLGRLLVATTLHQDIQDVIVLIHRSPQVMASAVNGEKHLIEMPLIAGPGPPTPELIRIGLAELAAPLPDSFVGHSDPTSKQQLFDVPIAEAEAEIQPDAVANDLSREAMVCVWVGWCGSIHNGLKTLYRYEERAFLSRGAMVEG
jgi:hypothetical protein